MSANYNEAKVIAAIVDLDVSPVAKESGSELVEAWINENHEYDNQFKTLEVEAGFLVWLDDKSVVIGVQDRIAEDNLAPFGCEWKSAKEPKRNKDGSDSAWWNEDKWLKQMQEGPQLAIYALALHEGAFYSSEQSKGRSFKIADPRIMIRAAVKSSPPRFWPSDDRNAGWFQFPNLALAHIKQGLKAKANHIRCARAAKLIPWQLTGMQCRNRFNGDLCQFYEMCSNHQHPEVLPSETKRVLFDQNDPAAKLVIPHIPKDKLLDPDFVIISSSSYSLSNECFEKYRIVSGALGGKEDNLNLNIGTALHGGLAAYYRQMKGEI